MTRPTRLLVALSLAVMTALPIAADDKDFLRPLGARVPANLLIVFGNSQTMTQTLSALTGTPMSTWDGDADSPGSKLGAGKKVIRKFIGDNHTLFNIGMTGFSRPPNFGSIDINQKHWVYESLDVDFLNDSFKEPAGTLSRWGPFGEGPCTSKTVPSCIDRSPNYVNLVDYANATLTGSFFGSNPTVTTYAYLVLQNTGSERKRIRMSIVAGKYGDAFTDGTLSSLRLGISGATPNGTHSIVVLKEYQTCANGCNNDANWGPATTPGGTIGPVTVRYRPPIAFPTTYFYPTGATNITGASIAGQYVGFLSDPAVDFDPNATCSGLEFQSNNNQVPLIKIPKDYFWGQACNSPQDSFNCAKRLLRLQAYIENYESGTFTPHDPDNPGYTTGVALDKYADDCDPTVMGTVQTGLDSIERQVILTSRNGSQAPIKGALENIYDYFSDPKHDGFKNGVRLDDPNKACRNTAVIFIYDTFNGCQNDSCSFLKSHVLTRLKSIGVPVYTIGFGASATSGVCAGATPPEGCPLVCIPKYTGAFKSDRTTPAYFPVTDEFGLEAALNAIADLVNESQKGFVASSVSTAQASGEQVTFLATFNASNNRSIWTGRVNAYKLESNGDLQFGLRTIDDPVDANDGLVVLAPSNKPESLKWNAGENLADTPGTGATDPSAVLTFVPGVAPSNSFYTDDSNDSNENIDTTFYPGRKIVFSLPQGYTAPVTTLPIPASNSVPETRLDMVSPPSFTPPPAWWPALKALLSPQSTPPPPFVANPLIEDTDAVNSLRFIWGDRNPIVAAAQPTGSATRFYGDWPTSTRASKLGDIFHSSPVLVGPPNNFAYFERNLNNYQDFRTTYEHRRRVLYFGANDGLLHAVDAGVWDRDRLSPQSSCDLDGTTRKHCFDLGTGTELFAYAPRAIMQIFKPLKDKVGIQTPTMEWTVDGPSTAGDVFIDSSHDGTPTPAQRAWHTVLIGGMREGSPFEGTTGAAPADSQGTYYALDVTQPDALTLGADLKPITIIPGSYNAPLCLNAGGDPGGTCGKDWPTVLWEIADVEDRDVTGTPGATYVDMGETWSKPALGRVRVCIDNCGSSTAPFPVNEDHYVAIFGGGFDRERKNLRGNWLYMVDVETGKVLYRANSSCGVATGASCPTYFASIPSEPAAIDGNSDGYIDVIYVGDLKGRMWRIDTTDLRQLGGTSPPSERFANKINMDAGGSGKPFLFFEAPQPSGTNVHPFYPIYYRPTVITIGYSVGGKPVVGIGFGTGDRDDITGQREPLSLTCGLPPGLPNPCQQRFYYIIDRNNSTTLTETDPDLLNIASATAGAATTAPINGWFLKLNLGERINADSLTVSGVIFFTTFNPLAAGNPTNPCTGNAPDCGLANGTARLYRVFYSTGNPYLGSDRGQTQQFGGFLSEPVYFQARDQSRNIMYTTENEVKQESAPGAKRTTVKSWKERSRRP